MAILTNKFFLAGLGFLVFLALVRIHANYHFERGIEHQIDLQRESDEKAEDILSDFEDTVDESEKDKQSEITETYREIITGITEADLEQAKEEALLAGRRQGRAEIVAKYRETDSCLGIELPIDDELLLAARAQQQDIFAGYSGDE